MQEMRTVHFRPFPTSLCGSRAFLIVIIMSIVMTCYYVTTFNANSKMMDTSEILEEQMASKVEDEIERKLKRARADMEQLKQLSLGRTFKKPPTFAPFATKPKPVALDLSGVDRLTGVTWESLDGRNLEDKQISLGENEKLRMYLLELRLQHEAGSKKESTTVFPGNPNLVKRLRGPKKVQRPGCNVSHVVRRLYDAVDYAPAYGCTAVFFTRVPGSGSALLMDVISMAKMMRPPDNTFVFVKYAPITSVSKALNKPELKFMAHMFEAAIQPVLYSRHVPFVDFSHMNVSNKEPLYISILQEPLTRLVTEYMYYHPHGARKQTMSFEECFSENRPECRSNTSAVSFLCGHEPFCRNVSQQTLQQAKRNVREKYLLVGIYEKVEEFTSLLSLFLPNFFIGTPAKLKITLLDRQPKDLAVQEAVDDLSAETKASLSRRPNVALDIEFYQFVKQRFHTIFRNITTKLSS